MDERGQAAVEYILLVALGLFLMIIAFTIAFYVKTFTDATIADIADARNKTIALVMR